MIRLPPRISPVFGSEIEQVKIGCLAAMGLDYIELGKQTGKMAAQVLRGEKKASEMNYETIKEAAFYGNTQVPGIWASHCRRI